MMALSKWEKRHRLNMYAYECRIKRIFEQAAKEAAFIGASLDGIYPSKPFSFDDYPLTKKKIESTLNRLHDDMQGTVLDGIEHEWTLANNKNDELCNFVFGDNAKEMSKAVAERYYKSNDGACMAFQERRVSGLNLSDRVWKYTNQFKEEMEMGLDAGLRAGKPAADLARDLKLYLRNPDKLFRRVAVKDENGDPVYDKNGKKVYRLSKAAAEYHPGQGVYRSSYKNARRLAVTETNMAYRTSDYTRYQQLDFVVGIKVVCSGNHPLEDICDELAGEYPKDFKFTGWHPHCRCHVETILKTREEMDADTKTILAGGRPSAGSSRKVSTPPEAFTDWVERNRDKIEAAQRYELRTGKSRVPYFVKDNMKNGDIDSLMRWNNPSALDIAVKRHAERTPAQARDIQERWDARKASMEAENRKEAIMQAAELRHAARTPEQTKAIQEAWDARKAEMHRQAILEAAKVRQAARTPEQVQSIMDAWKRRKDWISTEKYGRKILSVAEQISDMDVSALHAALANKDMAGVEAAAGKLKKSLLDIKGLSNIENPLEVAKKFSMAEAITVDREVARTFRRWTWDFTTEDSLNFLERKLVTQIGRVEATSFSTKGVAKEAFEKRLALVRTKKELKAVEDSLEECFKFAQTATSPKLQTLIGEFKAIMGGTDVALAKEKAKEIRARVSSLKYTQRKKVGKAGTATAQAFDPLVYNGRNIIDELNKMSEDDFIQTLSRGWNKKKRPCTYFTKDPNLFEEYIQGNISRQQYMEKVEEYLKTFKPGDPLPIPAYIAETRHLPWTAAERTQIWSRGFGEGYIGTSNSFKINGCIRNNMGRDPYSGGTITKDDLKTIKMMDDVIARSKLDRDITVFRCERKEFLESLLGNKKITDLQDVEREVQSLVGQTYTKKEFMSSSFNGNMNVFGGREVILQLHVKKGTHALITDNITESELIFGRGSKLLFRSVRLDKSVNKYIFECDVI